MFKPITSFLRHHYLTRYHGIYRHAKKLFVFDLALLGLAVVLFVATIFYSFWKPGTTDWLDLSVSLGTGRLVSGDNAAITVSYTNRSKFVLEDTTLALRLPPGFVVDRNKTPVSAFSEQSIIPLGELAPGGHGTATVYGQLWTEPNTPYDIIASLAYRAEGKTTKELKLGKYILTLPDSVVSVNLTNVPPALAKGTPKEIGLELFNSSQDSAATVQVVLEGVSSRLTTSTFTLSPQASQVIYTNISATANTNFAASLYVLVNGQAILQEKIIQPLTVLSPNVTIQAAWGQPTPTYAEAGGTVPLTISWQNGNTPLDGGRILLRFTPGTVDMKATEKLNGLYWLDNAIVIHGQARTLLNNIAPNTSETFTVNVKLLPTFSLGTNSVSSWSVTPVFEADMSKDGVNVQGSITGETISLPLATETHLTAKAVYYTSDGDQLGRGPIPPVPGETTSWWVEIRANNTVGALTNAKLSITLPPGVSMTGRQSVTLGGGLKYNTSTRTITWSAPLIPAWSTTGWYFAAAVTPDASYTGGPINLVQKITFTATDDTTGKTITLNKERVVGE